MTESRPPDHDFARKPIDPKTCRHQFPRIVDRWYGNGRYIVFQCNECDAYLRPKWDVVDSLGHPIPPKE